MTLAADLRALLSECDLDLDGELRDDTSLIRSGLLDSTALLRLVVWLEERSGVAVNPTLHDLPNEWDTITQIVRFVERRRDG